MSFAGIGSLRPTISNQRIIETIRENVEQTVTEFLFEPNDDQTRRMVMSIIDRYVDELFHRGLIQDYRVVCDRTNNTQEQIDNGRLQVDVYIKPQLQAEYIELNFVSTRQGVSFDEIINDHKEEIKMVIKEHFDEDVFKI